jgi:hypothetical protein
VAGRAVRRLARHPRGVLTQPRWYSASFIKAPVGRSARFCVLPAWLSRSNRPCCAPPTARHRLIGLATPVGPFPGRACRPGLRPCMHQTVSPLDVPRAPTGGEPSCSQLWESRPPSWLMTMARSVRQPALLDRSFKKQILAIPAQGKAGLFRRSTAPQHSQAWPQASLVW